MTTILQGNGLLDYGPFYHGTKADLKPGDLLEPGHSSNYGVGRRPTYSVPLSYVYFNDKIYFHSAKAGHKIDAITKNPKVSFSVIDEDTIVSEEYTTYFRSVIAFGKVRIVEGQSPS